MKKQIFIYKFKKKNKLNMQDNSQAYKNSLHDDQSNSNAINHIRKIKKQNFNLTQDEESAKKAFSDIISIDKKNIKINSKDINEYKEITKKNHPKDIKHSAILPTNKILKLMEADGKKNEEKKTFQRTDYRPKTISFSKDNIKKFLGIRAIPQTSIEKIIKIMNKVKSKLIANSENEILDEVDWVIKEILSDNMYKIEVHDKFSYEEKEFYKEYSNNKSDIFLRRDNFEKGKLI